MITQSCNPLAFARARLRGVCSNQNAILTEAARFCPIEAQFDMCLHDWNDHLYQVPLVIEQRRLFPPSPRLPVQRAIFHPLKANGRCLNRTMCELRVSVIC
jgi:hypothetical protein